VSRTVRTMLVYLIVITVGVMLVNTFVGSATAPDDLTLDELQENVRSGRITAVVIKQESNVIEGEITDPSGTRSFETNFPEGYEGDLTLGIGCARCHGDGTEHNDTGDPRDIVNPARLDIEAQSAVCFQCHMGGAMTLIKPGADLFAVRYVERKPLPQRLGLVLQEAADGLLLRWWERGTRPGQLL